MEVILEDDKWPFDLDEDKDEVEDEQGTSYEQGSFRFGDVEMPKGEIYELINEFWQRRKQLQQYRDDDFELNGWLSRVADTYLSSSQWYIDKIEPLLEYHAKPILRLEKDLRNELSRIYYQETVDEFIFTYMAEDIEWIQRKIDSSQRISRLAHFPKRPFVLSKSHEEL